MLSSRLSQGMRRVAGQTRLSPAGIAARCFADEAPRKKVTIDTLNKKKEAGEQIVQMAIYDYRSAVLADRIGVDILCVSDTGGMVLFGHQSTTTVTFEEVMMMTKAVARGSKLGLRMVDMPYGSFWKSPEQAVDNAMRFVAEGMGEVMKCEGNKHHAKNIEAIVQAGIPVQGHIGICPMRLPQLSGFRAQGRKAEEALRLIDDAHAFVEAGCFSIMNEVTSTEVTEYLGEHLSVPVISLGAGLGGDGVHIITSDLFNLADMCPRHSKVYKDLIPDMVSVMSQYRDEVRTKKYPGLEHSNLMFRKRKEHDDLKVFAKALNWTTKLEQLEAAEAAGKV